MALSLAYTDLITPVQVADLSLNSLGTQIETALRSGASSGSGDSSEIYRAAIREIKACTKLVEEYLNRELMIRPYTFRWRVDKIYNPWKQDARYTIPGNNPSYSAFFDNWPVVQIDSVNGDTDLAGEISIGRKDMSLAVINFDNDLSDYPTQAAGFAGYIRDDIEAPGSGETWNTACSTDELTGLDWFAEIPTIPQDIVDVCADLVIAKMRWQYQRIIGVDQSEMTADRLKMTVQRVTKDFITKTLDRISNYRHMPA